MTAYYNEFDPFAAAWLRELIKDGLIATGEVDERDIRDVEPGDLRGFTQCHFFAGIGGWSLALRLAGWPDDKPVWTGSCPCQPFSEAGKGGGFADERHLWPAFFHLIRVAKPVTVFGEQVDAALRHSWLTLVQTDLEGEGYRLGAVSAPAAGFGTFHIRQRLYFVADSRQVFGRWGTSQCRPIGSNEAEWDKETVDNKRGSTVGDMADSTSHRRAGCGTGGAVEEGRQPEPQPAGELSARLEGRGLLGGMGDSIGQGLQGYGRLVNINGEEGRETEERYGSTPGITGGFWGNAEWLPCRDQRYRPVEPTIFPLAHGIPNRVGQLRGAGNAIVPQQAAEFIKAFREVTE